MVALVGSHEIFFQKNVRCVHFEAQREKPMEKESKDLGGRRWNELAGS